MIAFELKQLRPILIHYIQLLKDIYERHDTTCRHKAHAEALLNKINMELKLK